jgi:hypothetical protein
MSMESHSAGARHALAPSHDVRVRVLGRLRGCRCPSHGVQADGALDGVGDAPEAHKGEGRVLWQEDLGQLRRSAALVSGGAGAGGEKAQAAAQRTSPNGWTAASTSS